METNVGIHNRFDIEVVDAKSGEVKQKAEALNVVCDTIYPRITTAGNTYFNYIVVGSGTGTPASTDTALFTAISGGAKSITDKTYSYSDGVASVTGKIVFSETEIVGATIREIGVAYDSRNIVTHAMLTDMNGNPITINKTNADILNIYATVFVHYDNENFCGGYAKLNPYSRFIKHALGCESLPGIYVMPGGKDNATTITTDMLPGTVSSSNKSITVTFSRIDSTKWNTCGGFDSLYIIGYTKPGVPEYIDTICRISSDYFTASQITNESVGTGDGLETEFSSDFPIDISKAKTVYVNGAVVGATVKRGVIDSRTTNALHILQLLDSSSTDANLVYRCPYALISNIGDDVGNGQVVFYNPLHETNEITNAYGFNESVYTSNDLTSWVAFNSSLGHNKYFRLNPRKKVWTMQMQTENNIIFSTPPSVGDVITIDYYPDCIPKDENHVLDVSVTFTFGEYDE